MRTKAVNNISIDMWYQHFLNVLGTNDPAHDESEDDIRDQEVDYVEEDVV